MRTAESVHRFLATRGVPVRGVSVVRDGVVEVDPPERQADADAALAGFDWSDAAQQADDEDRQPERKALRQAAAQAAADLDSYLALVNPTAVQTTAQVKRQAQILRAVIRRLIQID